MFKVSNDLIEKLKKNTTPNYALSDEEFALLKSVGSQNLGYSSRCSWPTFTQPCCLHPKNSELVFRIKSDYVPPQPELPKLEVGQVYVMHKKDVSKWAYGKFMYDISNGRFVFQKSSTTPDTFSIDPTKWTFHRIVTEEVR